MKILKGGPVAQEVIHFCTELIQTHNLCPGLSVLRIGNDPASQVYVQHKQKTAEKTGIFFQHHHFPESSSADEVFSCIQNCNQDPRIHGIIIQLPLPAGHPGRYYLEAVAPHKDVDGLGKKSDFVPCTPLGCWTLLKAYRIPLQGMHAVVVGRSDLVGKPLANCLLQENATVTIAHSHTQNLTQHTRLADLLCVCAGKPGLIRQQDIQPHAVVIDIGIHRTAEGLIGDVASDILCRAKTPVPGGVGPMTVALLMWNVVQSALRSRGAEPPSSEQFFERIQHRVSISA